jgi:substrate import-associated zinc metallohydrolase lipoprotein
MKTGKIIFALALLTLVLAPVSCREDEIDTGKSIFDTRERTLTGFDKWVDDNYRLAYNIKFLYKYDDLESDMDYNLIPARTEKVVQMSQLIKFLWLDSYSEVAGVAFTRKYTPRVIFLVGSGAWENNTYTQGTAESGLKVTLYKINEFNPRDVAKLNDTYFETMHHEFAHILHQTRMFDLSFGDWGGEYYVGSGWSNQSERYAARRGFVSNYSLSSINEDFVEVFSLYVCQSDEWWDDLKTMVLTPPTAEEISGNHVDFQADLTGEEAWAIIEKKIEFVRDYMDSTWGLDIDRLRATVRRRTAEVPQLRLMEEREF